MRREILDHDEQWIQVMSVAGVVYKLMLPSSGHAFISHGACFPRKLFLLGASPLL